MKHTGRVLSSSDTFGLDTIIRIPSGLGWKQVSCLGIPREQSLREKWGRTSRITGPVPLLPQTLGAVYATFKQHTPFDCSAIRLSRNRSSAYAHSESFPRSFVSRSCATSEACGCGALPERSRHSNARMREQDKFLTERASAVHESLPGRKKRLGTRCSPVTSITRGDGSHLRRSPIC